MTDNFITSDNGGITSRAMTQTEIANYLAIIADIEKENTRLAALQTAKQVARQAVLDKLGLTADEAAALFG